MGILGRGTPGTGPADDYMPVPTPAPPKKPGSWEVGGTGRNIVGYIADALAQMGGVHPVFAEALKGRQEEEQLTKRSMLAQLLEDQQWQRRQEYQRANPAPYRFESNSGDQMEVGPDGQARTLYKDPTPKIDWIQVKDPATGAISIVPRPQGAAPSAPPPGVTFKPRGASPSGSRTFPIR